MKKWIIDVREVQIIEGERSYTTSSHLVEACTDLEARLSFAKRCFGGERIQSVTEYEEVKKKKKV